MPIKKLIIALILAAVTMPAVSAAKKQKLEFHPGSELTLIGKLMDTPDRYARVDTIKYDGFTDYQRQKLNQQSSGLALVFNTNSDQISVKIDYKNRHHGYNGTDVAYAGIDLYIKRDGKWLYAGSNVPPAKGGPVSLVADMAPGEKECLLYLPLFSIVDEIYVGVTPGSTITPAPNPFQHKVVFFGSSFTHGASANRAGMAYPLQLERETGLYIASLGVSGNSKLQPGYARVLADTEADAFVFDAFSNPSTQEIKDLFPEFVRIIREKHPTTPLIFQQTIYRERRNFSTSWEKNEAEKMATAERMVRKAMETDPNIYFIEPDTGSDGATSTDGTHPSDLGYWRWMNSIKQPILDILAKYNLKVK